MWGEKLREVKALVATVNTQQHSNMSCSSQEGGDADMLVTAGVTVDGVTHALVAYLDDDEPLVAYAAMRHLEQRVVTIQHLHKAESTHQHKRLVELLLPAMTADGAAHRWTASSGYRFQLLRRLIQPKTSSDNSVDSSSEDDEDDESISPSSTGHGLRAVLRHTKLLQSIAIAFLQEDTLSVQPAQSTVVYELLGFLTELVEQLTGVAEQDEAKTLDLRGFYELVRTLMDMFSSRFEYVKQPTYVVNSIIGFLHQFLRFLNASAIAGSEFKSEWLRRFSRLVMAEPSSLSAFGLELLQQHQSSESSKISSQASFISLESTFPFLQSWISFVSAVALALIQVNAKVSPEWTHGGVISGLDYRHKLPDRATVLAVLSEQDDVMVEVLHTLLQLTLVVESQDGGHSTADPTFAWLVEYFCEQLDPDMLFADILDTFGHDHLVLLDLLISPETVMLEYLLRYLRRLEINWESSRAILSRRKSPQTVDAVLAVLIRLRLEIDKQVAVGMFPYNITPLLRRLVYIEELYEMA